VVAGVEGAGAGEGNGLGFRVSDEKKKDGGRKLEIKEKEVAGSGEVTLQDWVGPSDAIEGYVPRRDRTTEGTFLYMKGCLTPFLRFVRPVLNFEQLRKQ